MNNTELRELTGFEGRFFYLLTDFCEFVLFYVKSKIKIKHFVC